MKRLLILAVCIPASAVATATVASVGYPGGRITVPQITQFVPYTPGSVIVYWTQIQGTPTLTYRVARRSDGSKIWAEIGKTRATRLLDSPGRGRFWYRVALTPSTGVGPGGRWGHERFWDVR